MASEADEYRTPRSALPNAPTPKRRGQFQWFKDLFLPRRIPETPADAQNRMLLATEDYANAVRRCATIAEADAQIAAPALENCIAALELVRATAQSQMDAANASGFEIGREDVVDTLTSLDQALAGELEPANPQDQPYPRRATQKSTRLHHRSSRQDQSWEEHVARRAHW